MGYVKEPEGVDFVIKGKPLTDKQKQEISAFIKADKQQLEKRKTRLPKRVNRSRSSAQS